MADQKLFQIIDSATKSGKFGENLKLVSVTPTNIQGEDHFASDTIFAEVKLQNGSSEKCDRVVIKQQQHDAMKRSMMNTDAQFYNEVLMYSEILPFLDNGAILNDVFPKFIHGKATLGQNYEEDIVVLEDLRQCGYRLTNEKILLDYDHCVLALKKIAIFHALSYAKKQSNCKEFYEKVANKLVETRFIERRREDTNHFWGMTLPRGVLPLEKEDDKLNPVLDSLKKKFEDPYTMMKTLCTPEEPIAVLCHGDFCRNNMVFLYDANDKPVDVRFFDVATARYASPAIDLSFFLFMNTSTQLRRDHWHDFMAAYHESLSNAVPKCSIPSLGDIKKEVATKGVYGYTLCSFFIPMMVDDRRLELQEIVAMTPEELEELTKNRGGAPVTVIITDILRDIVKLTCECDQ